MVKFGMFISKGHSSGPMFKKPSRKVVALVAHISFPGLLTSSKTKVQSYIVTLCLVSSEVVETCEKSSLSSCRPIVLVPLPYLKTNSFVKGTMRSIG